MSRQLDHAIQLATKQIERDYAELLTRITTQLKPEKQPEGDSGTCSKSP